MPHHPIHCKFDPAHGIFANPMELRRHYDQQHSHEYQPSKWNDRLWQCRLCGKTFRAPQSHIRNAHRHDAPPLAPGESMIRTFFDEVTDDDQTAAVDRLPAQRPPRQQQHQTGAPWHADDIVLPVAASLAHPSGMIPVASLAAILAWRDATAVMLAQVTEPRRR